MNEMIKAFGLNAGKVWKVINKDGPQVQTKLLKKANIRIDEFYTALGWLARENKIYKEKRTYKLGETNLTDEIGKNAGMVWDVLGRKDEIDISAISRITNLDKNDCYSALGWLGREGKISAKIKIRKK
jgi:hypothetical protein